MKIISKNEFLKKYFPKEFEKKQREEEREKFEKKRKGDMWYPGRE